MGVDKTLRSLKEAYITFRKVLEPNYKGLNPDRKWYQEDSWVRAASMLQESGYSPYAYVKHVFDRFYHYGAFYPNHVTSLKSISEYSEAYPELTRNAQLSVYLDAYKLNARLKRGESIRSIITDTMNGMTPLFLYALARSEGYSDLEDQLLAPAKNMAKYEPYYLQFLSKWLPEGF